MRNKTNTAEDFDHDEALHALHGRPTKPEVDKLFAKWESMPAEMLMTYEDIATVIGCAFGTFRFNSIVTAWRKRLKIERNVVLYAEPKIGYKVADNSTRVSISAGGYKQGLKKIGRASAIAATTEDVGLTDQERRARDHVVIIAAKLKQHSLEYGRELKLPTLKIKRD